MTSGTGLVIDPFGPNVVQACEGLLGAFNRAGVLAPADVHVASRLSLLAGVSDEMVMLGTALSVRGPRFGHVRTSIREARSTVVSDVEDASTIDALPWPDPEKWLTAIANSPMVGLGEGTATDRPLRLVDGCLYLDRYWRDECFVAADLLLRCDTPLQPVDRPALRGGILRLFPEGSAPEQRWAAAAGLLRGLTVIAGGPGTGKTTTIARVMALLHEQAALAGVRPPLIALVAPTGKAAARMEESVRRSEPDLDLSGEVREWLRAAEGLTIHRLLRRRPDSSSRFRHDRNNRLPHDVVIVDETSMVSLSLMARLLEAIRNDARVILVGDPEQLTSVEAGAVLGDIVGPALSGVSMSAEMSDALYQLTGDRPPVAPQDRPTRLGDGMVMLRSNYRFSGALGDLASAVRLGNADAALSQLAAAHDGLRWVDADVAEIAGGKHPVGLSHVRDLAVESGRAVFDAATAGNESAAFDALSGFRLLCAHRTGPAGVDTWTSLVESWLSEDVEGFDPEPEWYPGRPVMITANDYSLRLFNGDTGATVLRQDGGLAVVFARGGSLVTVSPARLSETTTVYATTVHKAQGSEFDRAALILPPPESPLLTRELLYTAVTRARRGLVVVGGEQAVRVAIGRPVARASGLTERLWV